MKKKSTLLAFLLALCVQFGFAQERTVSGTVQDAESGNPIPGVAVVEKGTQNGTASDIEGRWELTVSQPNATLVISALGKKSREIALGDEDFLTISLAEASEKLNEVVITALGISREKKSVGYSVQEVDGEELSKAREVNLANSLSGRLAGVQVNSSTGSLGGSARILIRGAASIDNSSNQPLFVVDGVPLDNSNFTGFGNVGEGTSGIDQQRGSGGYDYGNAIQDINPEDIANISVLKGAAATALYGARGANGVILVTTKKGRSPAGRKGIGISYKFGVSMDNVYILPDYQNSYGGGFGFDTLWYDGNEDQFGGRSAGTYTDANGDSYDLLAQYAVDESWGPALDGQMVRHWWSWDEGHESFGEVAPWEAHPDNIRNFFQTGYTFNNSLSLYSGNERNNFRLSYSNLRQTGVFPNSDLERNNVSFTGGTYLTDDLRIKVGANYVRSDAVGRPGTGYDANNVMQQFNQWGQRQWSNERMEDYIYQGRQRSWNRQSYLEWRPQYTDNPYWTRLQNFQNDSRERVYGNLGLDYSLTENFSVDVTAMTDFYTDLREERVAIYSQEIPSYKVAERFVQESNYEAKFNYHDRFSDDQFGVVALVGGNIRQNMFRRLVGASVGGLNAPEFYNLANSVNPAETDQRTERRQVNSVFASASFDYQNMFYVDVTARNDWSSALPAANRSYFYPSISSSFVFTELDGFVNNDILSFGKVRAGYALVGNDTDPYSYAQYYIVDQSIAGNANLSLPNTLTNPNLVAENTRQWEVGADLRFFRNRLGIDVTYYQSNSFNQIISLPISASTGSSYKIINAGEMENKGVEIMVTGGIFTPQDRSEFGWNIAVNLARNRNRVVELYNDGETHITNYRLTQAPFAVSLQAVEGQPYGSIFGYAFQRDDDGNRLVDAAGRYVRSDEQEVIGSVLPDWTGGVSNDFSFMGFTLSALVDFQIGGDVFSTTNMWAKYSGMTEETVADNIREDGIVVDGVYAPETMIDGVDVSGQQNETVLDAQSHFFYNQGYVIGEADVYDAGYVYLREMTLNYTFPSSVSDGLGLQNLSAGIYGRNLWLIHKNIPHLDPTALLSSSGNIQGLEGAALPSIRSFGFNVSFNF